MQVAYDCGFRDFGESKVQELTAKMESFIRMQDGTYRTLATK